MRLRVCAAISLGLCARPAKAGRALSFFHRLPCGKKEKKALLGKQVFYVRDRAGKRNFCAARKKIGKKKEKIIEKKGESAIKTA